MNIFRQVSANNITLQDYPFRMELAMEAYIMENESILKLDDEEFSDPTVLEAEIAIEAGRSSGDGRIDILAQYSANTFAVVELKRGEINEKTLDQLTDYLTKRKDLIKYLPKDSETDETKQNWIGILVGRTISPELKSIIETKGLTILKDNTGTPIAEIPIAAITINRYRSLDRNEIFVVTDTYFKDPTTKDFSKYDFWYKDEKINDKPLNKGALVTEVIRHYVRQNPHIKINELKEEFNDKLQGRLGCFDEIGEAIRIKNKGRIYHRFGEKNEIVLSDATIVISNGWALENINWFINGKDGIKGAKDLGYRIENSSLYLTAPKLQQTR